MTNFYDRTYPPTGRVLCDGGLDTKFQRTIIPDNESPSCANVVFENGTVGTRGGTTALAASVGSFAVQGLYTRHLNDGSENLLMWASTNLYNYASAVFTMVSGSTGVFVSGSRIGAAEYENYLFMGQSGVSAPYKYNGQLTRHGVPQPVSALSVLSTSTGLLNGAYSWVYTNVNSNVVEGDVSTAISASITNGQVTVTVPTSVASFGVASRKLYRTVTSGVSYKLVATISDNTTTTYVDNIADASLGATAPTDQGEPPQYTVIKEHANRLFCNDTSALNFIWYSELANPYVFKATSFIRLGDNSGDLVRVIDVFDNGIVVFCAMFSYIVYMPDTDPTNWLVLRARTSFGSRSPYGSVPFDNKVMFAATEAGKFIGFATLAGDTVEPSSTFLTVSTAGSETQSDAIEPDMFEVQEAFLGNVSAISFKSRLYFAVTYQSPNTQNNRIYVYDYGISNLSKSKRGAWVPYTGLNASQFAIYDGKLYYGESTATGLVKQLETTSYNDNGAAINSYYETKEFSGRGNEEDLQKDFRTIQLLFDKPGDYFMTMRTKLDSDLGVGDPTTIDLSTPNDTWGNFLWGTGIWGSGKEFEDKRIFLGKKGGKRIAFRFDNQNVANQRFKVHGFRFTYNIKGKR